jgi:hypothetical protein
MAKAAYHILAQAFKAFFKEVGKTEKSITFFWREGDNKKCRGGALAPPSKGECEDSPLRESCSL